MNKDRMIKNNNTMTTCTTRFLWNGMDPQHLRQKVQRKHHNVRDIVFYTLNAITNQNVLWIEFHEAKVVSDNEWVVLN